ncbi:MAG TPA: hypothetical protein VF607_04935 [Verrucomicrobiae bacterium]
MNYRLFGLTLILMGTTGFILSKVAIDRAMDARNGLLTELAQRPVRENRMDSLEKSTADLAAITSQAGTLSPTDLTDRPEISTPAEESLTDLIRRNPEAAIQKVLSLPVGNERTIALNLLANTWAEQAPLATLAWAAQLSDADERLTVRSTALLQWGQTDPVKAMLYSQNCDLGTQTQSTMGFLAQKLAASDLALATRYVTQQADGELKDELAAHVSLVMAKQYPQLAEQFIAQQMTAGPAQIESAISILHQWALRDQSGAMAWAQAFPPGELRERALNEINGLAAYQAAP